MSCRQKKTSSAQPFQSSKPTLRAGSRLGSGCSRPSDEEVADVTPAQEERATLDGLQLFLAPPGKDKRRSTRAILISIGVSMRGRTVAWSIILEALGLDGRISGEHLRDLTRPLMRASDVARHKGVDPETIYRWHREGSRDLPEPIKVGKRGYRWIRAEIEAWEGIRAPITFPRLQKKRPRFGALQTFPKN